MTKLDTDGGLLWNTFLGGTGTDVCYGIAVDNAGNAYAAGYSTATWGSPVRAYYGSGQDAFVAKLNSSGVLGWNTFLGGSGTDGSWNIAVDASGNAYMAGYSTATWGSPKNGYAGGAEDGLVVKLNGACSPKANGNWNISTTWDCGAVPTTGDNVYFGSSYTVTLDIDTAVINDLTLSAGKLINNGAAHTLSLSGNWGNSATFTPGNFVGVVFSNTVTQTITGTTAFYNLTVNSGALADVGSSVITVNGTATNAGIIKRLAPAQSVALNTPFTFNDGVGQPSVVLTQTGGTAMGSTTVQINAHQPVTTTSLCGATTLGGMPVKRYFNITPTNGSNVTADLTLYFYSGASDSEANGNTSNLAIYHCNGTAWQRLSGSYTMGTSGNYTWLKLSGYTFASFSPFVVGGGPGNPTSVTLSSFDAKPGFDLGAWFKSWFK